MSEIDYNNSLLIELKFNLKEIDCENGCGCSVFSDTELIHLLEKHNGDVNAASYEGLIIKAENDAVSLPDGLEVTSNRKYWLSLARLYRPCKAHNIPRADEVICNDDKS